MPDEVQTTVRLREFAAECGVEVVQCGAGWGGRFGYKAADEPNVTICGYRTQAEAIKDWLEGQFGSIAGQAVRRRLRL